MSDDTKTELYRKRLDDLYALIQRLQPSSPEEDFERFGQFFTSDCTVYLKSMNMHRMPGISRVEAIDEIREVLEKVQIEEREVLHFAVASDGHTVFLETKQRINVMSDIIDPFYETEIVTFDDTGLIKEFKNYSCWSPVVDVVQKKTGKGPYAEGERREQFETHVKEMAMMKIAKRRARLDAEKTEKAQGGRGANCCT